MFTLLSWWCRFIFVGVLSEQMACGLTADPKSAEAAQTMGSDVLGCMFMQMATKKLAASCQVWCCNFLLFH